MNVSNFGHSYVSYLQGHFSQLDCNLTRSCQPKIASFWTQNFHSLQKSKFKLGISGEKSATKARKELQVLSISAHNFAKVICFQICWLCPRKFMQLATLEKVLLDLTFWLRSLHFNEEVSFQDLKFRSAKSLYARLPLPPFLPKVHHDNISAFWKPPFFKKPYVSWLYDLVDKKLGDFFKKDARIAAEKPFSRRI